MEKIIEVKNLRKKYKNDVVVDSVSFELEKGTIMGLLGPNGAGKTTTLKMITNLSSKDMGSIIINGVSLEKEPKQALSRVGAALDTPSFYNELTAKENLFYIQQMHKNFDKNQINELIDFVGLTGQEEKKVKNYSLGMKQRLGLARAMIGNPELIILDEPANGLDPQGMIQLYNLIRTLSKERKITFIVSSHLLHDMEELCTDVLILNNGKSVLQGKTIELKSKSTDLVEIEVEETTKFEALLAALQGVTMESKYRKRYNINIHSFSIDQLLRRIISQDIHINYVAVKEYSLLDLFLKITGGQK